MTDNPDRRWLRWISYVAIAVGVLYPLAIGPAARLYVLNMGPNSKWYHEIWLQGFYGRPFKCPLAKPLAKPVAAYITLWLPSHAHANAGNHGGIIFSRGTPLPSQRPTQDASTTRPGNSDGQNARDGS